MAKEAEEWLQALQDAGNHFKTGFESASRYDQVVELDAYIRSPTVHVSEKIDNIDSLLCTNLQWGLGRTDRFWDFVFINWKRGYSLWLGYWAFVHPSLKPKKDLVEYKEKIVDLKGEKKTVVKQQSLSAGSIVYLYEHPEKYSEIRRLPSQPPSRYAEESPKKEKITEEDLSYLKNVEDFGTEVVLNRWAWLCYNYLHHPDHVNTQKVLVIQSSAQASPSYIVEASGLRKPKATASGMQG